MALRDTFVSILAAPAGRAVSGPVRELVEEILAKRRFATPDDVAALRRELDAARTRPLPADPGAEVRMAALESEIASLKKRLNMAMGAIQAATAQLADAKRAADEALAAARQATQQATSALTTAEAAADGAQGIETQLDALEARAGRGLVVADSATDAAAPATSAAPAAGERDGCAVPGCDGTHRARGFCARHYQQWKRGSLENFVSADGSLVLGDGSRWRVPADLAGAHVTRLDDRLFAKGAPIAATPA